MHHDDIRHKLAEYIDGSVNDREKAEIEVHLKACPQCSSALSELRKTVEHIKAMEDIEPPAWMSQKIMAAVRAETEEKKGFLHKFFLPLHVKVPIQAVAVLFLAISAYYINQNIQPASELSGPSFRGSMERNEAPLTGAEKDTPGKTEGASFGSKKVQQSPGYKALDMKLEYERPAPPVPASPAEKMDRVAPDDASKKSSAAPRAGAPAVMQEQKAASGKALPIGEMQESEAPRPKRKSALVGDRMSSSVTYVVSVTNLETASREIETTIEELGDTISKTEQLDQIRIYTATMSIPHLEVLFQKLELIGTVVRKDTVLDLREDGILVRIELSLKPIPRDDVP